MNKIDIKLRVKHDILSNVEYNFTVLALDGLSVSMKNEVKIKEINGNEAELRVRRILNFGPGTDSYISVTYLVNVLLESNMDNEQLAAIIMENYRDLTSVFAKTSLIISQLTSSCPIGVLVTPPNCHPSNTEILY